MNHLDHIENRIQTNSIKWDKISPVFHLEDTSDILPMWIADMDFAAPKVLIEALEKRLNHPIFGYSYESDTSTNAFTSWVERRHGLSIQPNWVLYHQGVVPAIASIIETFTTENDAVIITPPVYSPFFHVPKRLNRTVKECPLIEKDGIYTFDFEKFDHISSADHVKLFIFCHPHNPGGIEWPEEVLLEIIRICNKNDVLILSDEIHADLMLDGNKHTPIQKIAGPLQNQVITCMAPTKTFNIAGIQVAMMIVPDDQKRRKLKKNANMHAQMGLNIFATTAVEAVYSAEGEFWLEELLPYLSANMDLVIEKITNAIPEIKIHKSQATYLLWIDYRDTGLKENEVMERLLKVGRLALEPGTKFGEQGNGFLRMNVACPREMVLDGINRFIKAFTK
ncbi:MalY/PatB family protein [Rummeliibacillus pycnus]|uniref:MalY/PatB family protein n=1 Tax=Rummeliibacillus pycnus TaxID=101070 RepID=UPI000C9C09D0|nr:MalY/PatB family protein [Rummeliibacillus pycnus]